MKIELAKENEIDQIAQVYQYARKFMKQTGNPNQWKDNRPDMALIVEDIKLKRFYCIKEDDQIVGVFMFGLLDDSTYHYIEGNWLNDDDYGVIHRIASNGKVKGILNHVLAFAKTQADNLRIDTHQDNKIMQHLLEKNGFVKCGIIYVDDGSPRLAYHSVQKRGD